MPAIHAFEEVVGRPLELQTVPEEALRAQLESAADPSQKSFAGVSLDFATGVPVDMTEALEAVPIPLLSVREFAEAYVGGAAAAH